MIFFPPPALFLLCPGRNLKPCCAGTFATTRELPCVFPATRTTLLATGAGRGAQAWELCLRHTRPNQPLDGAGLHPAERDFSKQYGKCLISLVNMLPTPLQCLEYCNKKLICKNNPVVTGEATAGAKGRELWRRGWRYPNCRSVVRRFTQDAMLGWKKRLRVLTARALRALLIGQAEGLCATPLQHPTAAGEGWRRSRWAILLQLAGDQVLNK